jgi:hypothetical protein
MWFLARCLRLAMSCPTSFHKDQHSWSCFFCYLEFPLFLSKFRCSYFPSNIVHHHSRRIFFPVWPTCLCSEYCMSWTKGVVYSTFTVGLQRKIGKRFFLVSLRLVASLVASFSFHRWTSDTCLQMFRQLVINHDWKSLNDWLNDTRFKFS